MNINQGKELKQDRMEVRNNFYRVIREGLPDKVTFEQRPNCTDIWRESIPGRGNSTGKGYETSMYLEQQRGQCGWRI